jgi:hypothetical protein
MLEVRAFCMQCRCERINSRLFLCSQHALGLSLRGFKFTSEFYMALGCNSHTKYRYSGSDLYADEHFSPYLYVYCEVFEHVQYMLGSNTVTKEGCAEASIV